LTGISERAQLLGGTLAIDSNRTSGTKISLQILLKEKE